MSGNVQGTEKHALSCKNGVEKRREEKKKEKKEIKINAALC